MRRILKVLHNPVYGGGCNEMTSLREPLARRGWDTVAIMSDEPGDAPERVRAEGVEVLERPLHRLRKTPDPRVQWAFTSSFRREVRMLRAEIRRLKADAVLVHGPTNPHGALAAHAEGVAVVWHIYDTVAPMWLRRLTMPMVTRRADVITTWGRALGLSHPGTEGLGERWVTVYPPVDLQRFSPDPERRRLARDELGIPREALAVVAVGNRNPSKGHEHLIRAVARLRADGADVVGRVLGAISPPHAAYEAMLHAEIARHGLDRDGAFTMVEPGGRVPALLPAFDVFALASVPFSEGMPTAILEAMACGLPVIGSDVGAVSEEIDHGRTGFVVAPEDDEVLTDVLGTLIGDAGLRERMGAAARSDAVERFSLEGLADLHAHAYDLAVAHRSSRA